MKSLTQFLVEPKGGGKFNNKIHKGAFELIISASEDDHLSANREAIVVKLPHGYKGDVEVGDTLIVHHNTFRHHYNMQGILQLSQFYFKDNIYAIEHDGFYLYKKPDGEWKANDRFCFVKPVKAEKGVIDKLTTEEPLVGEMQYPNEYLVSLGINKGDKVVFQPDSEYQFQIDGEKMYRMFDHAITLKLN
jgi:hypothetical protein